MQYITIAVDDKSYARMVAGYRVEGSVAYDPITEVGDLKAFNRLSRNHKSQNLVKKLPWGWVKESVERFKVFGSFPKDVGVAEVIALLNGHHRDAKNALIEYEIIERV